MIVEIVSLILTSHFRVTMGVLHHHHQQQFQKVTITKHQSVFEPRQLQSFRATGDGLDSGEGGEEHPPPLPYKKRHSKWSWEESVSIIILGALEVV